MRRRPRRHGRTTANNRQAPWHTHASALHYAGFTPPEAAARMGHGLDLHWRTYAHVIEAMSGKRYDGLDELIAAARAELGFPSASQASDATD